MIQRKRGLTVAREPSGRLSRKTAVQIDARSPVAVKRLMAAALSKMADPEWGTEIGRLLLTGKIDEKMFEAGKRWGRLAERFRMATCTPSPDPKSMNFGGSGRSVEVDPDSEEGVRRAKFDRGVIVDMQNAHGALASVGSSAERQVRNTCERGEMVIGPVALAAITKGLERLALHWGLTAQQNIGKRVR